MSETRLQAAAAASAVLLAAIVAGVAGISIAAAATDEMPKELGQQRQALRNGQLPNNFPFRNGAGTAATFSTAGAVDLNNPFHRSPQGSNGRSCESCHLPHAG